MDHRVVKATKLYKAELLHSDSFPSSIASGHSHNPIYKNIYKNIFYYDCSLCLIAFVDAVCKDKTKPTCTSLVWKVRRWADAYVPLNPHCTLSSTDLNGTFGLRQDMLPKPVEILVIKHWLSKVNVHLPPTGLKHGERSTESRGEGWSHYQCAEKADVYQGYTSWAEPMLKFFDTVIQCVFWFILEGLSYWAARFSSIACLISLKGKTHSEFI